MEQSGFRSKRQTKDNLVTLTQKAKESFERGWKTITVFFDLASAFDKVWHDGLIYKSNELGVPLYLLNILISFFKDRFFEIKIGSFTSARFKATRGCPQGACVSPATYKAYSNDTPLSNTKNVSYALLFADDLVHFRMFKKYNQGIENEINKYIQSLVNWASTWRMSFAPQKTTFTVFNAKNDDTLIKRINLTMNGTKISYERNPKFLGITFDPNLNFEEHSLKIREKAIDRLSVIKILSHETW